MSAFNDDKYLENKVVSLIKEFNVQRIIETGTHEANTTLKMAQWKLPVITIEINNNYFIKCSKKLLLLNNVKLYKGSSPDVLNLVLSKMKNEIILFYLDAHWYNYNPLLDELKTIYHNKIKNCVIVIHDFYNPEHPDFGYDKFPNGKIYEFKNIKNHIDKIYNKYNIEYNSQAVGAKRGVIFITPKI